MKCDTSDYDKKLKDAKKKTKSFSQGGVQDLAKFAAGFIASKAAIDGFNRVMSSSQTLGDQYARTMSVAKTITDDFVYSIANADFTRFTDGLKGIRQRASEAYDALDQLGNTNISYKYFNASERATFREGILAAKDTTLSPEERRAGFETAKASLARLEEMTAKLSDDTVDYLRKEIGKMAGLNASDVEMDALAKALAVDVSRNSAELRQGITDRYNEYQRRYAAEVTDITPGLKGNEYGLYWQSGDKKLALKNAKALNAEYSETITTYTLLNRLTDEQLQNLSQQAMSVDQSKYAMGELVTQLREAEKVLNQPIKGGTVGSVFTPRMGTAQGLLGGWQEYANRPKEKGLELPATIEKYAQPIIYNKEQLDELAETSTTATEALGGIASAMGAISGVMDEGSAAWMNYASGVIFSIQSALPSIQALATAQAAVAGTTAAMNPWTAIAGVAAIASIAAALANLPKFATGGVVPGNSFSSDNVLIRANSGEVVLTKQMANNIGTMLQGGMGGVVKFKIEGGDLVGVLNNHNRITSRSYVREVC